MNKVESIIKQIELDFIEFSGKALKEREKELPLKNREQIKALIYNLLTSSKWRSQISYNDYSQILDIWFNHLEN